jgi:manganese/zinc/iron transport system substrate-binding protein
MRVPAVLLLCALLLSGCPGGSKQPGAAGSGAGKRIRIVTTIGMLADAAENIGGGRVSVEALMGPGVDPHLYRASAGDVSRLSEADIVLFLGLHLEAQMAEVLEQLAERGGRPKAVAVGEYLDKARLREADGSTGGAYDPHVWFDVNLWQQAVSGVADVLAEYDAGNAAEYRANAAQYLAKLDLLDKYCRQKMESIPAEARVLVTAHDAFHYFGNAYGVEVRGLQGISTVAEAGTADVSALGKFLADKRIPAIFVESSVPQRQIQAVQEAARSHGWEVKLGGELFSDAMGNAGTPEGTYIGMVTHNADTIAGALGGAR